jgi:serine beta-lactamase-like protein LACTB, mitochondrial
MTILLTDRARGRLERYLAEVRDVVARCGEADPDEVVAGIREHVDAELAAAGLDEPVTAEALDRVLERLGAPERWHEATSGSAPAARTAPTAFTPLLAFALAVTGALIAAFAMPLPGLTLIAFGALAARAALEGGASFEGSSGGLLRLYWTTAVFALVGAVALAPAAVLWGSAQIGGAIDHWANPGAPPVPGTRSTTYWWRVAGAALAVSAVWWAALAMIALRWPHLANRLLGPAPLRLTRRFVIAFGLPAVVGLGGASCNPAPAVQVDAPPTSTVAIDSAYLTTIDSVRRLLAPLANHGVAISVAVHQGGRPIWVEGMGPVGPDEDQPADPQETLFRVYSLSKPLTAAAGARLMEAGALDPDAPVQRYVPGFPAKDRPVTVMGLATHRAGVRHYETGEAHMRRRCERPADALHFFADDPLLGTANIGQEHYSSWGFVLLSAALEGAAGEPFAKVVRDGVLAPSGMTATRLDDGSVQGPGQAPPLAESGDSVAAANVVDNSCKFGAGAYLSTAADMARFGVALVDGTLLSPPSLQLFLRGGDRYRAQGVGVGGTAFLLAHQPSTTSIALLANVSGETLGPELQRAFRVLEEGFVLPAALILGRQIQTAHHGQWPPEGGVPPQGSA